MRALAPTLLLCLSSSLLAQAPEPRSVAVEALNLAVSMTGHEMATCATAHPQHAQRFSESVKVARTKLEAAVEKLRAQRAVDLELKVPEVLVVGREMNAALMASDTSLRSLERCNRTAAEIANVSDREATELMNQLVTTLVTGVVTHQQGMNRALR